MYKFFLKINKNYVQEYVNMGYKIPHRLKKAVFKRQNQFAAGRLCAISAIRGLIGEFDDEIKQDHNYRPVWPDNIIGSISHTDSHAVALVEHKKNFLSLGIDIEHIDLSKDKLDSISSVVMTDTENNLVNTSCHYDNDQLNLIIPYVIFSSKESLFKCINPLNNIMFDFKDVEVVDFDFKRNKTKIKLLRQLGEKPEMQKGQIFMGDFSYLFDDELIYTQVGYKNNMS